MPQTELKTKKGKLTPYAFSCGYVEEHEHGVRIYMQHGVYFVTRPHNHGGHQDVREDSKTTNKLPEARKFARKMAMEATRKFEIKQTGDPYSSHWEACEFTHSFDDDTAVYRGDLPHLRKEELTAYLRKLYPGCIVRVHPNWR